MENNEEDRLIKELLANYKTPEDLIGENGLLKRLTKKLVEGALGAEMTHHLGYPKHDVLGQGSGNSRNGASAKTLKGDFGEVEIEVPRDRNGSFEPKIVGKHQRHFDGAIPAESTYRESRFPASRRDSSRSTKLRSRCCS
jgi:putative transposase